MIGKKEEVDQKVAELGQEIKKAKKTIGTMESHEQVVLNDVAAVQGFLSKVGTSWEGVLDHCNLEKKVAERVALQQSKWSKKKRGVEEKGGEVRRRGDREG